MRKTIFLSLLFIGVISLQSQAQVPGDFNCNRMVNGQDITKYHLDVRNLILAPMDTATCFWNNGDVNSDGLFSTNADSRQLLYRFRGRPDSNVTPQPAYLDSILIADAWGMPGDSVLMPVEINIAEDMGAIELQIHYHDNYLLNPNFILMPSFTTVHCFLNDTTAYLLYSNSDSVAAGRYQIGNLKFVISNDAPLDTTLDVSLVGGRYFPTGFTNYSYPTHFITPIMINGAVHVGASRIDELDLPANFSFGNYPNPFNAQTTIEYELPSASNVALSIFDISGRKIETLVDGYQGGGHHQIIWDAKGYSSGIYFYRIRAGKFEQSKRALLLK